ncbi:hypothetical protein V494_04539 [Pseudogymnoascus sp. VKM F-4513 (FW-928)]|nr:hypothetical protein V494_04539 [Pseudogymnoascus sp. VKM F-4513 (FW-928)]
MNGRVMDDHVAWLGHAREKARIGIEARIEEAAGLGAVEGGDIGLKGLRVAAVPVKQARTAAAKTGG